MLTSEDVDFGFNDVFPEPPRPPSPEPTIAIYTRSHSNLNQEHNPSSSSSEWNEVKLKLVGSHPLWGHYLWNAARAFATYLDNNFNLYVGRNVLELGAGGGLPGIVTALNGAKRIVLTDYPDSVLVENLIENVRQNVPPEILPNMSVMGYKWGASVEDVLNADRMSTEPMPPERISGFDCIILSDLIFNHSQHEALLKSCEMALRADPTELQRSPHGSLGLRPCVLVFYTHHRPHLAHRDMKFFSMARSRGWYCEEILVERFPPMFPDDPGDEEVRATVHGWKLTRTETDLRS